MLNASVNLYIADVKWEEGTDLVIAGKELFGINPRKVSIPLQGIGLKVEQDLAGRILLLQKFEVK